MAAFKSANEKLFDSSVLHSHFVERFQNGQARRVAIFLRDEVLPKIDAKIPKLMKLGQDVTKHNEMKRILLKILDEGFDTINAAQLTELTAFAKAEALFEVNRMNQAVLKGLDLDFVNPDLRTISNILTKDPFKGRVMKDWYRDLSGSTQEALQTQIVEGVRNGESLIEIANRVRGTGAFEGSNMKTAIRHAETITRTAINHASTQARESTYSANDDIVKEVQIVATLDDRTSDICMSEDGKRYPIGEGPRPPYHFNCRTTTTPVLKTWKELGINLKEAPKGTRASMSGPTDAKTYGEWLKGQDQTTIRRALGPTRAKLFQEGQIGVDDLVNSNLKPLTLPEIYKAQGIDPEEILGFAA